MRFLLIFVLVHFSLNAQTVFWCENFSSGGTSCNNAGIGWTLNVASGSNSYNANDWIINSSSPNPSGAPSGGNRLHITCDDADAFCSAYGGPGAVYNAGGISSIATNRFSYSPAISTLGHYNITLRFWYVSNGQAGTDYGQVRYSTDGGMTWVDFITKYAGTSTWNQASIVLPSACDNISDLRIGFRWVNNDDVTGNDPPFSIDDIELLVTAAPGPIAQIEASADTVCQGDCIYYNDVSTGNPDQWLWSFPGAIPSSSIMQQPSPVCYSIAGVYYTYLRVTNSQGSDIDSVKIVVLPNAAATIMANPTSGVAPITVDFNAAVTASGYLWYPGDGSPSANTQDYSHTYLLPGIYTASLVTFTDNGCKDSSAVDITLVETSGLIIPNVFTPNGDEINETFKPTYINIVNVKGQIFNRWGVKMFEWQSTDSFWDGRYKGIKADAGTYFFVIEALGADQMIYEKTGSLMLLY